MSATVPSAPPPVASTSAATVLSRRRRRRDAALVNVGRLSVVVVGLAAWQLSVTVGLIDEFDVSTPGDVLTTLTEMLQSSELWQNVWATALATTIGFGLGAALGIAVGLAVGSSRFLDRLTSPFLAMANSMPRIALAPLFIIWFGLSMWAKVWLAVSLVFFVLVYNTKGGVQTIDEDHKVLARMLDMGRWERFRKITLPTCLPAVMAGLRLSVVFSLLGVIASEMIAARDGLGQLAVEASSTFRVDRLFSILIVIAGMAVVMNTMLDLVERKAIRWKEER